MLVELLLVKDEIACCGGSKRCFLHINRLKVLSFSEKNGLVKTEELNFSIACFFLYRIELNAVCEFKTGYMYDDVKLLGNKSYV